MGLGDWPCELSAGGSTGASEDFHSFHVGASLDVDTHDTTPAHDPKFYFSDVTPLTPNPKLQLQVAFRP